MRHKRPRSLENKKKKKNKKNILQGKAYFGAKKSADYNWKFSEPKLKRAIKPLCDCKRSKYSKSSIMCNTFTEKDRQDILFDGYWKIESWEDKKGFVRGPSDARWSEEKN